MHELIERLAGVANGGTSFANEYAKKYMIKIVVNILFALTKEDLKIIEKEIENKY